MTYIKQTITEMRCDGPKCKSVGHPYPEADGSLGLIHGWFHYDPRYMTGLLQIVPRTRVDFCSMECRDKWLEEWTKQLSDCIESTDVIYQFSK